MVNLGTMNSGLSSADARKRLARFGLNEIKKEKVKSPFKLLLDQFKSPLVLILIFACVISASIGDWFEAIAILAILILNAMIGFVQEYRAETAIAALKKMTAPRARVVRDGVQIQISASEIVPEDLIVLEAGDIIAADARVLEASHLQTNEALLTGESLPVSKGAGQDSASLSLSQRKTAVYMGTLVTRGTGVVQVTHTGMETEIGKIAHLITTAESTLSPFQIQLIRVGRMLLMLCLVTVTVVAVLGLIQGRSLAEMLLFSLSLAVAAVPEGMPAIVTVALATGVQRMAARNALVRKLPSVETLGCVSIIFTDKTGTLTTGNMRVREMWGEDHDQVIRVAASCSDAELSSDGVSGMGDPMEVAILVEASQRGIERDSIEKSAPRVSTHPFDHELKRMSVYRQDQKLYMKGAVESVLALCQISQVEMASTHQSHHEMTSRGLRVLAVAKGDSEKEAGLHLVGLIGFADPPRTEVAEAIAEARRAGITPVMITGDHPTTAAAVARELGLVVAEESLTGRVYARATPEDKINLIREWKNKGAVVAMTGDGVNDAPALREAHVGIAMGRTGTEVTRQTADIVLADDNFATIIAAIREGRGIYENIRKAIQFLLIGNLGELVVVLGASILGSPTPLLAAHLLWINLITDSLPGLALIADPISPETMRRPPRPRGELLLGPPEWRRILLFGTIEALVVLSFFEWNRTRFGLEQARSLAFSTLVFCQFFRSFSARSNYTTVFRLGPLTNPWLVGVILISSALQLSLHFIPWMQKSFSLLPLTLGDLQHIFLLALIPVTVIELQKVMIRKFDKN